MTLSGRFRPFLAALPNALSIFRGILGLMLPALILSSSLGLHLWAIALYVIGALSDFFDGWLARRYQLQTQLGKWVDPFTDKILNLAPLVAFALLGFFSIWWIVPIFIREVVVTFCRTAWLLEGKSFGAEKLGKWKFVFQVLVIAFSLLCMLSFDYSFLSFLKSFLLVLLPILLFFTLWITLVSGSSFLIAQKTHFASEGFAKFTLALGVGLLPMAPGTWGSIFGLVLVFFTQINGGLYGATFLFLLGCGYWAYKRLEKTLEKDPAFVVVDEACGIFITFMFIPITWVSVLLGFCLFRLFDIWKPFPIKHLEKIRGFWGILLDDIGAGIYAWFILFILFK